jgi:hypothetical protein
MNIHDLLNPSFLSQPSTPPPLMSRHGRSEIDVALDAVAGMKAADDFTRAIFDQNRLEMPLDWENQYLNGHATTSQIDVRGRPLTLEVMKEVAEKLKSPLRVPQMMARLDWEKLDPELKVGLDAMESPFLPEGQVLVVEPWEPGFKFERLKPQEPLPDFAGFCHSRICNGIGLPSSVFSNECSLRFAPVMQRPSFVIMPFEVPSVPTKMDLHKARIISKFRYWATRQMALQRDDYLHRLAQEGPSVRYHGATGEDRRYARWRLAFHEAVRLMEQI